MAYQRRSITNSHQMSIDKILILNRIEHMKIDKKAKFVDYLSIIVEKRYFIIKTVVSVTITAMIISLLIRPKYTATANVLPPNIQQETMFSLLQGGIGSNLGGLSSLGGILPGASTPSDLFAAILKSGTISSKIIYKYDLKNIFEARTMDDTHKMLKSITKIGVTPEGIISISVTWHDKYLAADIANSFVEELDKFNTETAMTAGKKYRIFIEQRLADNVDTLQQAEENLRSFQESHRTIALEEEIISAIQTIAELKSQIILLEVQKGSMSSSSNLSNPYLYNINKELRELKKQLKKIEFGDKDTTTMEFGAGFSVSFSELPEVALEYARLVRDVEVQSAIFTLLTQQYEQAKIMELKDTPTVQYLDRASPPERKSSPKRGRIVIFSAIAGLFLAIVASFMMESFEQLKNQSVEYKNWIEIFNKIGKDLQKIKIKISLFFRARFKS